MSNALTIANVEAGIDSLAPQIASLLPPDVPADKFRSVALAAIRNNAELMRCEPQSLFNACLNAAQDGLMPDGREGAIVPRKGKAVWQPMIQGIYKRVKSSGSVASLSANVVYDGEAFEVLLGDEDRIVHRRDMARVARGNEVAVYAIATLKDGTKEREVMTWDQVEAVRKSSAMPNSGPWTQWADEMARKTVVRRLAKRLPVIDPADEALQRTVNRVDSLYDFGAAPPTIEAPPVKAAAAATPRPPRVSEKTAAVYDTAGADDPGGWKEFAYKVHTSLGTVQSRAEVLAIGDRRAITQALEAPDAPPWLKRDLEAMFAAAYKRFPQAELPDVEIAGAEKIASGND